MGYARRNCVLDQQLKRCLGLRIVARYFKNICKVYLWPDFNISQYPDVLGVYVEFFIQEYIYSNISYNVRLCSIITIKTRITIPPSN